MGTSALQNMGNSRMAGTERDIYATAISLFTHRHSADMHDRQVATVRRLCKLHHDGFYVADLRNLAKLLETMRTLVQDGKEMFVEPLVEMLQICSIPFVKEIASEEYRNFSPLCDTIEELGKLLACTDKRIVLAAGEVLATYAGSEEGLPATVSYHHQVLEHSKVVASVAEALRSSGDMDRQVLLQLLRVLLELSRTKELAVQLLEEECLPVVIEALLCGFKTEIVLFAVETLWNVFELVPESVARVATPRTVEVLAKGLNELLVEGHRTQDKELRNEILILITYLASEPACHAAFAATGLLETILTTASAVEADSGQSTVKAFVLTSGNEDFEMKRAMINIVCAVASSEVCMEKIAGHPVFLGALLLHVDSRLEQHVARRKYSRQQARQLQVQVLEALAAIVPNCAELFRDLEGVQIILEFLAEESEESLRSASLKTLQNIASLEGFQEELGGRACAMMLSLIKERALHPFGIRQSALAVLSQLCRDYPPNQEVVGELQGVDLIVDNLEWTVEETTREEPMCLTAVDALWNVCCGNEVNQQLLDMAQGMQALLSLLEDCPHMMKFLLTSCLASLVESSELRNSVYAWRSRHSRRGVIPLLLNLWDNETARIETEEKEHIEVHNVRRLREDEMESAQLVEFVTVANLHTKLHALLSCLEFQVGADTLSTDEQKKLMLTQHYLDDKDATLWRTFSKELSEEGIRPVTPDHRLLEARFLADGENEEGLHERLMERDEEQEAQDMRELKTFFARIHEEEAAKKSTARRLNSNLPASTRTKIIVDSHKAQVFPPLLNPKAESDNAKSAQSAGAGQGAANNGGKDGGTGVEAFLKDSSTSKLARSRPSSSSSRKGTPAGGGLHAAAALRAS